MSGGGGKRGPKRDYAAEAAYRKEMEALQAERDKLQMEKEGRDRLRKAASGAGGASGTLGEGGWRGRGLLSGK